ncbi:MAG: HAMP domain-containing protein [Anaerolineae bacterium]|nr:HAMP domain-containing protein [Anaerolineae bacterium]NIN97869.1 HAMP domain-containing protein [Anaerolineae bacterium]NIQ80848.1 HAMP domain-containing protein [Anaerolineae bacterium]
MAMKDWLQRLGGDLRSQMLLWIVLPVAAILLLLSFTSIYSHQRAMRALVENRDLALAKLAAKGIEEGLHNCLHDLENLRDQGRFRDLEPTDYPVLLQEYSPQLDAFDEGVALMTRDGELLGAWPDTEVWTARMQQVMPYLEQESLGESPALLITWEEPSSRRTVAAWVVAGVGQGGALVGAFSPEGCGAEHTLRDLTVGSAGEAYLIDGRGAVLYPPNRVQLESEAAIHLRMDGTDMAEAGAHVHQDLAGEPMVLAHAPLGQDGWMVIVQEPWNDLLAPMMRYSQITPLVVLLIALGALMTIALGVRQVLQPLEDLRHSARKIAEGDFVAARDPVGGIAEIDELRITINEMADRVRNYQTAMRSYAAAVTSAQDDERLRLGHELHDDTVQSLVVLSQELERVQRDLPATAEPAREKLADLREMTYSIIDHLRRYIGDLRPVYLEDLGLIPALEKLADDLAVGEAIAVNLKVDGTVHRLPADVELATFRIVQEALNNVGQHAEASRAEVRVRFESDAVSVSIEDDGIGFEPPETLSALTERGRFGLMGMQERAALLGGWLSVNSKPGGGTRILFYLPTSG